MLKKGLIQVYTGSTGELNLAHLGLCMRASGQGLRIFMLGFLHHPFLEAEHKALSTLKPLVDFDIPALKGNQDSDIKPVERGEAQKRVQEARRLIRGGYDIIMLEGINQAVDTGLLSMGDVLGLIEEKPAQMELVITGKNAVHEIIDRAELVTEMRGQKMPPSLYNVDKYCGEKGIEVITGDGKGKTTHCLGRAMLNAADGRRTKVLQFIKSPRDYGEVIACKRFENLDIRSMGKGFVIGKPKESGKHIEAANAAWKTCLQEISSRKFDLIVLDEINVAVHLGLISPEAVEEMMLSRPNDLHIMMSGRNANSMIKERASAVFEMKEIKHPFHQGVHARKGIEY